MRAQRFEDLIAWQHARALVRAIYGAFSTGPGSRDFGFKNQITRAVVSVMSNIVEGFARRSHVEFKRFLDIARASAREVQSLLYVAKDLGYLGEGQFLNMYVAAGEAVAIITGLMMSIPD